jgi:heme-degrading monooxygenase HmoA
MVDAAIRRVDANGDSSAEAPGFLFRYRMETPNEPERISTVSGWESREAYRAWKDARNAHDASVGAENPYARWVNEVFEVVRVHGDVPGPVEA